VQIDPDPGFVVAIITADGGKGCIGRKVPGLQAAAAVFMARRDRGVRSL